jgi:acetyl-CoA carboxylase carboxyl transferase subunit alpha
VITGYLEFEKPIIELEKKIEELQKFTHRERLDLSSEINRLQDKLKKLQSKTYKSLTPWQKVQIARHPKRPYTMDYVGMIMTDFIELHGDRHFADDKAMICGLAKLGQYDILIVGHQKGRDTKENLMRNFGSAHPEGYRKAMRLMKMADKFSVPVVAFIDTPGAYPGIGAEERGQAEAIAYNLREMACLKVPVIVVVIGEGGSGGALGIGLGDRICMLENSYYSVISPEGCAAILWKDRTKAADAAAVLKLTGQDLLKLGIVDEVIPEPRGGAHKDAAVTANNLRKTLIKYLDELSVMDKEILMKERYEKFRRIGVYAQKENKD